MRRRGWGAALALAGTVLMAGCNLHVHGSGAVGFFVPSQSPSDVLALGNRLGVQVQGLSGYTDGTSWDSIGSYEPPSTTLRLYLGLSMAADGSSPAQTPSHLAQFQEVAQHLVAGGQAYAIIRVGWEWNTDFFPWGVQNTTPAQYVTAFDDIVTTMRGVPGQHFLFDWCAAAGAAPTNGSYADSYPGDQYVDYVGTDIYDNPVTTWAQGFDAVGGPGSTVTFAQAHGKLVSVPEWGLDGSDDPAFVDNVANFANNPADDVGYSSYFSDDTTINSDITQFPASAAEFTKNFGP